VIDQAQALAAETPITMEAICDWCGITRQAHYQLQKRQRVRRTREEEIICPLVQRWRQRHPAMGTRKLLKVLRPLLHLKGIQIGRDRFFALLKEADLLVPRRRNRRRTTWAGDWRCWNRLEEAQIDGPNQAWASDITYLETEEGFCYLSLLTDVHSRYIVGFDVSTSLAVEGAMRALNRAAQQQRVRPAGLIHHSDRGVQYTCHVYRNRLHRLGMLSSMGRTGNCYDNALAERVNGILKNEYGLGHCFVSVAQACRAVAEAVHLYNTERPHLALDYQTPLEVHGTYLHRLPPGIVGDGRLVEIVAHFFGMAPGSRVGGSLPTCVALDAGVSPKHNRAISANLMP
jgi:transposase InsO family protein